MLEAVSHDFALKDFEEVCMLSLVQVLPVRVCTLVVHSYLYTCCMYVGYIAICTHVACMLYVQLSVHMLHVCWMYSYLYTCCMYGVYGVGTTIAM